MPNKNNAHLFLFRENRENFEKILVRKKISSGIRTRNRHTHGASKHYALDDSTSLSWLCQIKYSFDIDITFKKFIIHLRFKFSIKT